MCDWTLNEFQDEKSRSNSTTSDSRRCSSFRMGSRSYTHEDSRFALKVLLRPSALLKQYVFLFHFTVFADCYNRRRHITIIASCDSNTIAIGPYSLLTSCYAHTKCVCVCVKGLQKVWCTPLTYIAVA